VLAIAPCVRPPLAGVRVGYSLGRLQIVLAEYRNYQGGIMPAGPGARELTEFFASIDKDLAGHEMTAPASSPATSTS
jgi:hypothetical protein